MKRRQWEREAEFWSLLIFFHLQHTNYRQLCNGNCKKTVIDTFLGQRGPLIKLSIPIPSRPQQFSFFSFSSSSCFFCPLTPGHPCHPVCPVNLSPCHHRHPLHPRHPRLLCQGQGSISRTFLEQFILVAYILHQEGAQR